MKPRYRLTIELSSDLERDEDALQAAAGQRRLQINMRGILIAFVWVAIWGVGWVSGEWFTGGSQNSLKITLFSLLLMAPPAAAIGALAKHQLLGLACGIASGLSFSLWIFVNGG